MSRRTAGRAPVNLCPYCGEADLRPDVPDDGGGPDGPHRHRDDDGWFCRACRRRFAVSYRGTVPT